MKNWIGILFLIDLIMRIVILALFLIFVRVTITDGQIGMMLAVPEATPPVGCTGGPGDVCDGLVLWLDANDYDGDGDTTNNTAGTKSTWTDISGNGNDATGAAGQQASIVLDNLNGQDGFDFDGSNDRFTTGAISAMDNITEQTQFAVWDRDSGTGSLAFAVNDYNANNNATMFYMDASGGTARFLARTSTGTGKISQGSINVNDPGYAAGFWDTADSVMVIVNGTEATPQTGANMTLDTHENVTIGSFTGGGWYFNGKIYEIIIYNRELTRAEIDAVESYLATKYNL